MSDEKSLVRLSWQSSRIKIVACKTCDGEGVTRREECISYHNNDYETITSVCKACDGDGRVLETITTYKIEIADDYVDHRGHPKYEKLNGRTTRDIYQIK